MVDFHVMLERMGSSRKMAALGKAGGLRGGPARARSLSRKRRVAIASQAARSRWSVRLVFGRRPAGDAELKSVVAFYGRPCSRGRFGNLESVVMRALVAARKDASLARMLPAFLHRVARNLDLHRLVLMAESKGQERFLGYFFELADRLSGDRSFHGAVERLGRRAKPDRDVYLFPQVAKLELGSKVARSQTSPHARAWGLVTGMPDEVFASYFEKSEG